MDRSDTGSDSAPSEDLTDSRDPIWTVPSNWRSAYIAQFSILSIIGIGYIIWYETTQTTPANAASAARAVILGIGQVGVSAAVVSILTTESVRFIMVVGGWLEEVLKRRRERAIAEGIEEGIAKAVDKAVGEAVDKAVEEAVAENTEKVRSEDRAKFRAWYERHQEAIARGEPFDEPPPDLD